MVGSSSSPTKHNRNIPIRHCVSRVFGEGISQYPMSTGFLYERTLNLPTFTSLSVIENFQQYQSTTISVYVFTQGQRRVREDELYVEKKGWRLWQLVLVEVRMVIYGPTPGCHHSVPVSSIGRVFIGILERKVSDSNCPFYIL